jgi:serine/threonine protein kinase
MNVSKILKNETFAKTKTGSPLYTSPEVWDDSTYNEKCDIWSLGIMIY